jgi:CheY-like chemotaxis protein
MEHQAAQQTKSTVVVVEDDILVRMTIAEYLRDCGLRVIEAATGEEAVLILQQVDLAIDVVLSDVHLGAGMDGFAVAQWVRMHRPSVQVVLAGTPDRAANAAGSLCDEGPHLSKPYDPQIVLDRIKRLLAERK